MLSIERCRKILGTKAENLTDEEIEKVRDELYIGANLAFENWRRCTSTNEGELSPLLAGVKPVLTNK